jgi:hypothetical protein
LTVAGYAIAWRWQGADLFQHPGHWLLVFMAAFHMAMMLNGFAERMYFTAQTSAWPLRAVVMAILYVPLLVFQLAPGIFSVYVGLKKCRQSHWKWVFVVYVLAALFLIATAWAGSRLGRAGLDVSRYSYFGGALTSIGMEMTALAYAIWSDRKHGLSRDVLHWCGVGLYVATTTWMMVVWIAWWLFT